MATGARRGPRPPPPLLTRVLRTAGLVVVASGLFVLVLSVVTLCSLPP